MQRLMGCHMGPGCSGAFCFVEKLWANPSLFHRMRRWSLFVLLMTKFWPTGDVKSRTGTKGKLCWWFRGCAFPPPPPPPSPPPPPPPLFFFFFFFQSSIFAVSYVLNCSTLGIFN
uniref:Uncharacterized protein n=1 Tax=Cacopsylla melanoneura TaxID=428564 RepID=A0A8D8Q442_9HEMI